MTYKARVLPRKQQRQLARMDRIMDLFCSEEEAMKMTGYSGSWLRKYRTTDQPGTPIYKRYSNGCILYLKESLTGIRNPK